MECKEAVDIWTKDFWTDEEIERAGTLNLGSMNCPEVFAPSKSAETSC